MTDRFEANPAEQTESAPRPRWRTPQLTVSSLEAVTESGFTPGPDGTGVTYYGS